ncbi:hypothetical protein [Pectobacterium betavasculorum]|uniref:Phage protein n=1 Tax=Pectobacterium betavasculorum TaxID=55207 RepID=A0ABR4UZJ5_9GAMM|nr:hypothetical protein [Pectobacterium betavasculorum]KFX20274.1 hypothetical protein JV35_09180 [Pectobacterium betavasculorum]
MAGQLDEAAKQILGTLLADFTDRGLTAKDLKDRYEGPQIVAVATAVCNIDDITQVDFDVAFSELEKGNLIRTGPMESYKNRPGDSMYIIASFSKREYVYLTEEGYKAARRTPNRPQRVNRVVNHVHISGGQFSNLQLAAGEQIQQTMSVTTGTDSEIIAQLISILESQGVQIGDEQRNDIESAVSEANDGNAGSAKKLLMKACGSAWENIQQIAWPIIGELVKKSVGL